jgi:predicted nucleic acid-binding protein
MALGLTLDTGALIALERGDRRMRRVLLGATRTEVQITVPTPVLVEWWRGSRQRRLQDELLASVDIEPLSERLAKIAGEAVGHVRGATAVDAIVMASAAQRGDIVYTSDFDDMQKLREVFPSVTVMRC